MFGYREARWPDAALPIIITAPIKMKNLLDQSLRDSCAQWNKAAGIKIIDYEFDDYEFDDYGYSNSDLETYRDGKRRIYFVSDWSRISDDPTQLALTLYESVYFTIIEADVFFNLNFDFYYDGAIGRLRPGEEDFRTTLLHEMGHVLGLEHSNFQDSVMWFQANPMCPALNLSQSDIEAVKKRYSHPEKLFTPSY